MTERDQGSGSLRWIVIALVLGSLLLGGLALLVLRPGAGEAPRRWVKAVDRNVLGGALHRRLTGDPPTSEEHLDVAPPAAGAYEWARSRPFLAIGHRLGPSAGSGPNTLLTYRRGRDLGFRIFEVDLTLTTDGRLACYHGGSGTVRDTLTWEGYRMRAAEGTCRFGDLVEAARADADVRFVLDVKNRFDEAYDRIRREIGEDGPGSSFIPQIYHFGQARRFREDPFFAGILFTTYRSALPLAETFAYARRTGIEVVTVSVDGLAEWDGPLPERPLVLVHPVNDAALALRLRTRGVDGIYTGYLAPPILERIVSGSDSVP